MSFGENIYSHCQTQRKELYMETVTIFRVEKNGIGPYQIRDDFWPNHGEDAATRIFDQDVWDTFQDELCGAHTGCSSHPTWIREDFKSYDPFYLAGFASMEDLKEWFGRFLDDLLWKFQFEIVEYQVPEENVQYGNWQVCFLPVKEEEYV